LLLATANIIAAHLARSNKGEPEVVQIDTVDLIEMTAMFNDILDLFITVENGISLYHSDVYQGGA
jgi:hypothetical protein